MPYPTIRWDLLSQSLDWYRSKGYQYIEVPWVVQEKAIQVTMPGDRKALETRDGYLVGSAEQSFIQMMQDNQLAPGRYVACSPCFRDEVEDETHQRYFMKVELIEVFQASTFTLHQATAKMVRDAMGFFLSVIPAPGAFNVTQVGFNTQDIELNGVEIGSYGFRETTLSSKRILEHKWVYGTGLALPRFNVAAETKPR